MKKLYVDTNIVIDLLSRREPYSDEAAALFSLADKNQVETPPRSSVFHLSAESRRYPPRLCELAARAKLPIT
jgi:predicted nucleic acid-binding protein